MEERIEYRNGNGFSKQDRSNDSSEKNNGVRSSLINVEKLLQLEKLKIPPYQRPYKWTVKNVNQLLDDIYDHRSKNSYRLGAIVIHKDDNGDLNIVDGQQRTVTFLLIAKSIIRFKEEKVEIPGLKNRIEVLSKNLINPEFTSEISAANIQKNYREVERRIAGFDEETIEFILDKCQFIRFDLFDISEAFQFFDSQNARGKDLEPHDLLKAFHLREFSDEDRGLEREIVAGWEKIQTKKLSKLFAEYLFRIKGWSKGRSSRYFTKSEVDLFKGININKVETFPYTQLLRIAHHYTDQYNSSYERKIDRNYSGFPFQLDQPIINGRRFFELVKHYEEVFSELFAEEERESKLNSLAKDVLNTLEKYDGRNRTGDGYVRMLFDCTLFYYIDKFGFREVSKAVEKAFIWSYSLRLRHQAVQLASVDNYVLNETNLFKAIRDASDPSEVFSIYLTPIDEVRSTKTEKIEDLFIKLRYYDAHG